MLYYLEKMDILIFNHHPDYSYQAWKGFTELGHNVFFATEGLTKECGSKNSSTIGNKFLFIDKLMEPKELFPDIDVNLKDDLEKIELCITIDPNLANSLVHDRLVFGAVLKEFLDRNNNYERFLKVSSVQYASNFGALFATYYVPPYGNITQGGSITQLITQINKAFFSEQLVDLRKRGFPVIVAGSRLAPDGVVNDRKILEKTTLLVHEKSFGSNCNAVCKAFDAGVPVYMTRFTRRNLGFEDLPDYMFIFADDYDLVTAYEIAGTKDNLSIQKTFREIRSLARLKIDLNNVILNSDLDSRKAIMTNYLNPVYPKRGPFLKFKEGLKYFLK